MPQQFIVPTIFNVFIGVWYYVLMAEMDELQNVPLHVFCILSRVFYGMVVSFPFNTIIQIVLSRMTLWVSVLILVLDVAQVISIFQQFNTYTLTDSLSILFSAIFILSDLLFILQLYTHATEKKIKIVKVEPKEVKMSEKDEKNGKNATTNNVPELIVEESYSNFNLLGMRQRNNPIKF